MILVSLALFRLANTLPGECEGDCSSFCRVKYRGEKNFYNKTDGVCYSVQICGNDQVYDFEFNRCNDLVSAPASNLTGFSENTASGVKVFCDHGKILGVSCVCDPGYYTRVYQDPGQGVRMCDTRDKPQSNFTEGPNGEIYLSAGNDFGDIKLDPLYKEIILVVLFPATCCVSCCLVKRLKKRCH